jgi:hypothetical protein
MPSLRTLRFAILVATACASVALALPRSGPRAVAGRAPDCIRPAVGAGSVPHSGAAQDTMGKPRVYCETPTPGPSPTSPAIFPDLEVRGMAIDHAPCKTCADYGPYFGVLLEVGTSGGESPPFLVELNGRLQAVGRLPWGHYVNVWFPGVPTGETVVIVDPLDAVFEGGAEGNNVLRGVLSMPTLLPQPVTCTPAATPAARPDLSVGSMMIALQPDWSCGTPPVLGIHAEVPNRGAADAGPFVVTVNGTPIAQGGLAAGQSSEVFVPGYRYGTEQEVVVDSSDQVAESDEGNNTARQMVPIPTLPPCPSDTPTAPPTVEPTRTVTSPPTLTPVRPTPTPSPTATPSLTPIPGPTLAPGRSYLPLVTTQMTLSRDMAGPARGSVPTAHRTATPAWRRPPVRRCPRWPQMPCADGCGCRWFPLGRHRSPVDLTVRSLIAAPDARGLDMGRHSVYTRVAKRIWES